MNDPVEDSMVLLRQDAIDRGLQEAAIVYGWSAIKYRAERFQRMMQEYAQPSHSPLTTER